MAINKATLSKKVKGVMQYIYPKTSSDMVIHDDTTVESKLNTLSNSITSQGTTASTAKAAIDEHLTDNENPHNVTAAQVGAAAESHTHAARDVTSGTFDAARIPNLPASKITSGTFDVERGGTGKSSVTSGSYLVGNGTGALVEKTPAEVLEDIGAVGPDHGTHVTFSSDNPAMDNIASPGTEDTVARSDHIHPTDTSRAPVASPTFTGTPAAPTAPVGTNTTQIATTAFVKSAVDASANTINQTISNHVNNTDNPHGVTIAQIGAASADDLTTLEGTVNSHTGNTNNPHGVTIAQIGAAAASEVEAARTATSDNAAKSNLAARLTADYNALDNAIDEAKSAADDAQGDIDAHVANTSNPHGVTTTQIGAVPTTRKVNGKALSADVDLSYSDVGAAAESHGTHVEYSTAAPEMDGIANVGTAGTVARSDHRHPTDTSRASASDLTAHTGNTNNPHGVTAAQINAVPTSRTINGKELSENIELSYGDVGAAAASHGTHVTYGSTNPNMDGTASAGTANSVSRSDHTHPTDTSRASATDLSSHTSNTNNPHGVTAAQVGAVPTTRTVNGKALSDDIELSYGDVGAAAASHGTHVTYASGTATPKMDGTAAHGTASTVSRSDHVHPTDTSRAAASDLTAHTGNTSNPHGVTAAQVGAVPTTRTVNGKALSENISLTAADVGAIATETNLSKAANSGSGNAITNIEVNGHQMTLVFGTTFATKAELDEVATKAANAMFYNGTIGTDGVITSVPTKPAGGETYKVITAGTYAGFACKVGDLISYSATHGWTYIPSGDEPSGTVTNVAAGTGLTGGPISTTGTIKANLASETALSGDKIYNVGVDADGHLAVQVPWTDTNDNTTDLGSMTGTLAVGKGGTGKSSITKGNYIVGNGSSALTEKTPAQVLSDIGAVPTTRTINGKVLSENVTLSASDVGAAASSHGTHVEYSTTNPVADGTATPGTADTVARSDHRHPTDTSRAPTSHASTATTYGTGNSSNYGHVKLSDSTSTTSGVSGGIAATPTAVKAAYDLANTAQNTAWGVYDRATWYGTCETAAGTAAKVIKLASTMDTSQWAISAGYNIKVKFTVNSTVALTTLTIQDSSGNSVEAAKNVYAFGTTTIPAYTFVANEVVSFTYDGTNWIMDKGRYADTSYYGITKLAGLGTNSSSLAASSAGLYSHAYSNNQHVFYGTCATAATTQTKSVSLTSTAGYSLKDGITIRVKFTYAQQYNGACYLTVNGTSKYAYSYASGSTANNVKWGAGDVVEFTYNGTYWIAGPVTSNGTATCPAAASWSGPTNGLYYTTVSIAGFTADTIVHISPVISTSSTTDGEAAQTAWDTHYFSETVSGGIKFYAKETPTVAVTFNWQVVR